MKLCDAETLLQVLKMEGPIKQPWSVETDEGITLTALPAGVAFGAYTLKDRFTALPRYNYSRMVIFTGQHGNHVPVSAKLGAHHLFAQEHWVYRMEMREAMRQAVSEAANGGEMLPRKKGHSATDVRPYPEDFKMTLFWPAISWHYEGKIDVPKRELYFIKREFCELLERFVST